MADYDPKKIAGSLKPPLCLFPPSALVMASLAMSAGAKKYGAYNWRGQKLLASTYAHACLRHVVSFWDGEDYSDDILDGDIRIHHLAHNIASSAVLIDAIVTGGWVDDRPKGGVTAELIRKFTVKRGHP